ncbi:M13 family metallopeptidase [Sphingorhabdus pulchriflava]|nr:M13 family metallopeptidase [Sphingorhabdus pulchriflava]
MGFYRNAKLMLMTLSLASALSVPLAAQDIPQKVQIGEWGVDTEGMSKTVRPGDDFYRYVNERWLNTAKIPTGMSSNDSFVEVFLSTERRVADIITEAREGNDAPGSPEQLIADFHRSYSDMAKRNAVGLVPIASTLGTISGLKTREDLARAMALRTVGGLFGNGVTSDSNDPARQIAVVGADGMTMPSRDYYLNEGEPYARYREALKAYMADTFLRAGFPDAEARALRIFALETEVAKRQWSPLEMRDVVRMNNVMTPEELKAYAPGFPWDVYLAEAGYSNEKRLKVITDTATRDVAKLFAETPIDDIRSYMIFRLLDFWSPYLSERWVQAHFDFHKTTLQGTAQRRTADLEAVAAVNEVLSEEIGRIYVAEYFGSADRAKVAEMVDYLRSTYRERIEKLEWMDEPTRNEALSKLEKISSFIGFPDKWHDRSSVRIAPDDLVGNVNRLIEWEHADSLKRLAEGTRKWEFAYPPQEINAGYSSARNSITFPAGILQPPFFDPKADPAVNFGSIAAVIGHEIGHGFDDQGSRSDGDGKLRDWWTAASRAEFEKRTAGLVDQFNQYEPLPGLKINGKQNLGENIGDLGGLSVAYAAYRKFVAEKQGGKAPKIGQFTGDQRFFLAWAQVWRELVVDAEQRRRILSDPHSPGEFRANGIVRNIDAWYDAFGVKPSDKLYLPPEQRVRIW